MTRSLVIVAVVLLAVAIRGSRRLSRRPRANRGLDAVASPIGLVAAREIRERVRSRIFRVGTLVVLVAVAAAIVIPAVRHSTPRPQRVGVVGAVSGSFRASLAGSAKDVGTTVRFVAEPTRGAASAALREGRIDVALVNESELVVYKRFSATDTSTTNQFVSLAARNLGIARAIGQAHLTPSQIAQLYGATPMPVTSVVGGATPGPSGVNATSIVGIVLVFIMLSQYDTWILIGVMEEKSSRVIEVLLASLRPIQLLAGKVLGIGLVALFQAALITAVALGVAQAVGSSLVSGTHPLVLLATLVWLVAGYAFYSWVYAAAGSMAERQDQIQTLAFPLTLPMIFGYVTAITAASSGSASAMVTVLAYVPPTAPFAMPVMVALHAVNAWQFALSLAISAVVTFFTARFAASIYRRAILRTGRRVRWREVLARGTAPGPTPGKP
ncbi:MAG: ABC transporter permease [Acidobacteriota bacterium]|nr:ABC transporter permease [Acidobacteriota bacterium]